MEKEKTRIVVSNVRLSGYCYNQIVNTKYTWWSFLPKNLLEQFGFDFLIYIRSIKFQNDLYKKQSHFKFCLVDL